MSPKNINVDNLPKDGGKKRKGRPKTVKPVLKTPSLIKLKYKLPSDTTNNPNIGNEIILNNDTISVFEQPVIVKIEKGKQITNTIKVEKLDKKKKDTVRRQCVKKIHNDRETTFENTQVLKKKSCPRLAPMQCETNETKVVFEEVKQPVIKKKTAVKRQHVKKNLNGEQTTSTTTEYDVNGEVTKVAFEDVKLPVTKKRPAAKRQRGRKVDATVNTQVAIEEGKQPIKQKVKRQRKTKNVAKIKNLEQTIPEDKPVTNDCTIESKVASIEDNNNQFDKQLLNGQYYKIMLANEVIKSVLPKKSKSLDISTVENELQTNNTILKSNVAPRKTVTGTKSGCRKTVLNMVSNIKGPVKNVAVKLRKYTSGISNAKKHPDFNRKSNISTKADSKNSTIMTNNKVISIKQTKAAPRSRKLNGVIISKKSNNTKTKNNNIDINESRARRPSTTSSNNSWKNDISSSSISTLMTVQSKDFVCFDNKIPVLQIENIDNELTQDAKKIMFKGNTNKREKYVQRCNSSSTCSSKSDLTKLNTIIDNDQNCINERNVAAMISKYPSLNLSASSSSSRRSSYKSSSSSSSCSSPCDAIGTVDMRNRVKNRFNPEKFVNKTREQPSTSTERLLKTLSPLEELKLSTKMFDSNKIIMYPNFDGTKYNKAFVKEAMDKIFKYDVLEDKLELIRFCDDFVKQLYIDDSENYFSDSKNRNTDVSRPKTPVTLYSKNTDLVNESDNRKKDCYNHNKTEESYFPKEVKAIVTDDVTEKINENNSSEHNSHVIDNDDDDALSLFAESFSELESCKKNTFNNSQRSEEYVPRPVCSRTEESHNYQPTKILNGNIDDNSQKYTSTPEKQNVDSIPSLIELRKGPDFNEDLIIFEDTAGDFSQISPYITDAATKDTIDKNAPRVMALNYKPAIIRESKIFRGYCIYFLKSACKNPYCRFTHNLQPNIQDIKNSLRQISEEAFIQDYMFMRSFLKLRRFYGLYFVEEAIRRELTRILVEMAIDVNVKSYANSVEDMNFKTESLEKILIYLNTVDLSICDDLLLYVMKQQDNVSLCDVFMSVIATSQNFSRFKQVFINLTDFMYKNGRKFNVYVADSILERLCVLPYEEALARALLYILRNTDVTVFSNSKMQYLERQLLTSNGHMYQELKSLKDQALVKQPVLEDNYQNSYESLNISNARMSLLGHAEKSTMTSERTHREMTRLDTFDCDNANKHIETKCKMKLNVEKLPRFNLNVNINNSDYMKNANNPFVKRVQFNTIEFIDNKNPIANTTLDDERVQSMTWRKPSVQGVVGVNHNASKAVTNKFAFRNRIICDNNFKKSLQRNQIWPPLKRHSDTSYGGSAAKFQRNSGQNHFQRDLL